MKKYRRVFLLICPLLLIVVTIGVMTVYKAALKSEMPHASKDTYNFLTGISMILLLMGAYLSVIVIQQEKIHKKDEDYKRQLSLYRVSEAGGVFTARLDGEMTLLYGNDKYYAINEASPQKMRRERLMHFIHPDDRERLRNAIDDAEKCGNMHIECSVKIITAEKKLKYVMLSGNIQRNRRGSVLNGVVVDITAQKLTEFELAKEREALQISEKRYNIALNVAAVSIWEYDVREKFISQTEQSIKMHGFLQRVDNVPDSLVKSGYVHPEDAKSFYQMYEKIANGEKKAEGVFRVKNSDGSAYWYEHIRYINIFDNDSLPVKAIGVSTDVTEKMEALKKFKDAVKLRQAASYNTFLSAIIDVDDNTIEDFETISEEYIARTDIITPEQLMAEIANEVSNDNKVKRSIMALDRKALKKSFKEGHEHISFEFQRLNEQGEMHWFSLDVHIVQNPQTDRVSAFVYLKDIDEQKRKMEELEQRASEDSLTGLLNRKTARNMIDGYIGEEGSNNLNAFFMIDLDNFKAINDKISHYEGDRVLIQISEEIKNSFISSDIIARVGGDEFVVFLKNIPSVGFACSKAAALCQRLQFVAKGENVEIEVTASIGIAICRCGNKDFDELYKEADIALYSSKDSGKNCYTLVPDEQSCELDAKPLEYIEPDGKYAKIHQTIQLSELLKYMDGGVILLEITDGILPIYTSEGFYNSLKYTENEPLFLDAVNRADREDVKRALLAVANGEAADADIMYRADVCFYQQEQRWHNMRAVRIPYNDSTNPVVLAVVTDVTKQKQLELQLIDDKQKLDLAFEQTELKLWEYNRIDKSLSFYNEKKTIPNVMEYELKNEIVHKASIADYREFNEKMESNAPSGSVVVKTKALSDRYKWYRFSFRNIFDKNGCWVKTIGVSERLPDIEARKNRVSYEEKLHSFMAEYTIMQTRTNISTDSSQINYCGRNGEARDISGSYDAIYNKIASYFADENERFVFLEKFSTNGLINAYERGDKLLSLEWKCKNESGKIIWVLYTVSIIKEPITDELYAYGDLVGIDVKKRYEIAVEQSMKRETLTLLYDKQSIKLLIRHILNHRVYSSNAMCALILININNLDEVREDNSIAIIHNSLLEIGRIIKMILPQETVAGAMAENQIAIFTPQINELKEQEHIAGSIMETLAKFRCNAAICEELTFNVGCAAARVGGTTFSGLYEAASDAIARCAETNQDKFWSMANCAASLKNGEKVSPEMLSAEENALLLECSTFFIAEDLLSPSAEESILKKIGVYYNAKAVYHLEFSHDTRLLNIHGAWFEEPMKYVKREPFHLEDDPMVSKVLVSQKALAKTMKALGEHCIVAPINGDSAVRGIVLIRDPKKHAEEISGITRICTMWQMLSTRGKGENEISVELDALTGCYNRTGYNKLMKRDFGGCSSVGIMYADINGISDVNVHEGVEYGDNVIKQAAAIITRNFGAENVFRISGDEFIVVVTDIMHGVFMSGCNSSAEEFKFVYENGMSIGYTWSDRDFKVKELIEHALLLMQIEKQNAHERKKHIVRTDSTQILEDLLINIKNEKFLMYLQPKQSIKKNKVVGAEALVRYREKDKILAPSEFIGKYEKRGLVKHIDMFMFEQAVRTIAGLRLAADAEFTIAVNYSRMTLLDPSVFEKTRSIVEKYDIDPSRIEIEITETVGNIENATIAKICRQYKSVGFRLTLDDFGSDYSSMAILSVVHFDVLKIDKSLVNDIISNIAARDLVKNIIDFCHKQRIKVVAEGVEVEEQLELLREMNCDIIQGFIIEKALPPSEFKNKYLTE